MGKQTEVIELTHLTARKQAPFGEFLVEQQAIDRYQLFRALQVQDLVPGTRLGHCAVALGFVPREKVEQLYRSFAAREVDDLEAASTTSFERAVDVVEIEIPMD